MMDKKSDYEEISSQQLKELLNNKNFSGVIVFATDWMGGSALLHTMMERLVSNFKGKVQFFYTDVEKVKTSDFQLGINDRILTTLLFKNGSLVDRVIGIPSKNLLKEKIEQLSA